MLEDFFTIINPGASATAQMKIMENLASLMTIVENMMPKSAVVCIISTYIGGVHFHNHVIWHTNANTVDCDANTEMYYYS